MSLLNSEFRIPNSESSLKSEFPNELSQRGRPDVILRYSEGSGRPAKGARCFGVPQHDNHSIRRRTFATQDSEFGDSEFGNSEFHNRSLPRQGAADWL